ncbi:MAG: 2-phospho-L-lactate transferase [Chloroflexi bacterium]|nr:2-phospho-L-lactate transferase [Chloroflexota bacterium]
MRVVVLAGGTGGTKLAHGFAQLPDVELAVVANVGDDAEFHGLLVCPDIDALLYTLSGLIDAERGWGVAGDTHTAHDMFARFGEETWFTVGDADLATHAYRTRLLREGASLTDATAAMAAALGISARILPASDERWRTRIRTDAGELAFQDWFVRLRTEPAAIGVSHDGPGIAAPAALEAVANADLVVIGPSNPIVSIGPILALAGMATAVAARPVIAVSPIIAGEALKGPAARMMESLGHGSGAVAVARYYHALDAGLVDRFVLDEADAALAPDIADLGMAPAVLPTIMRTDADRATLARTLVGSDP